jgi:hypothetical protein
MSIQKKIEEIRQQPENVRLRWIWGLTLFFTFCVVLIWGIALKVQNELAKEEKALTPQEESFLNEFQVQKRSLEEVTKGLGEAYKNTREVMKPENQENPNETPQ